ncbi:Uncharacterised protein [Salmonella enterica subsp. arizonae]|uniref:Uncharacterized protein n=1 Tax=Salmonella enterica subsp. arizonae TaxID=59203 RepID=A0A379T8D6_SALER|nr:Uncharacterised protein [Salmonella enterica subsp. arizonae]
MDNQINRNTMHIIFKTTFIFKTAPEAGGFKEFQETRDNAACDINPAKRPPGLTPDRRQIGP